jgi:hypothetical protein
MDEHRRDVPLWNANEDEYRQLFQSEKTINMDDERALNLHKIFFKQARNSTKID